MHWKTKEGEYISISDLSDNHLMNILNMLNQKQTYKVSTGELWEMEITFKTSEIDEYIRKNIMNNWQDTEFQNDLIYWLENKKKKYHELEKEAKMRNLK